MNWNAAVWLLIALVVPVLVIVLFPLLARRLLCLQEVATTKQAELNKLLPGISTKRIFIWETNNSVCNAGVLGCLPGFDLLIVSDVLWNRLSQPTIAAILAHELGHIRQWHIPIRLLIVFAGGISGITMVQWTQPTLLPPLWNQLLILLATGLYMSMMLKIVSPLLEYDADAAAIRLFQESKLSQDDAKLLLVKSLWKLTYFSGIGPDEETWFYPSFSQRRQAIMQSSHSWNLTALIRGSLSIVVIGQCVLIAICLNLLLFP